MAESKEPRYDSNPFIQEMIIRESSSLTKISNTNKRIVDTDKMILEDVKVVYAAERLMDREPYCKSFKPLFTVLPNLSKASIRVYCHMMLNVVKWNDDRIIMHMQDVITNAKLTNESVFYSVINEFVKEKILARHTITHIYWLNPNYFYYGERRRLINHEVQISKETIKSLVQNENNGTGNSETNSTTDITSIAEYPIN